MTTAEQLVVIDRWANCKCCHSRAPTDPCVCRLVDGRWVCEDEAPAPPPKLSPRDKAERRKKK